jgi:hypothetical protein
VSGTSHFLILTVFSGLVSVVFAVVHTHVARLQVRYGLKVFAVFLLTALVLGWLMAPFPS